ncbi:hypothetical protein DPEC_G00136800 [Dallia pectoralis]|uniref:Uncharacterized protein n=1 Tax=Dallia pectoralis TaxID=75939 RepID=A0ACC2GLK4_DALPE|nr:hypothetical protein DPEC_G00136800 [Dallia pectoralis]
MSFCLKDRRWWLAGGRLGCMHHCHPQAWLTGEHSTIVPCSLPRTLVPVEALEKNEEVVTRSSSVPGSRRDATTSEALSTAKFNRQIWCAAGNQPGTSHVSLFTATRERRTQSVRRHPPTL